MLDDLLERKKITLLEYDTYQTFNMSEFGSRWLKSQKELFFAIQDVTPSIETLSALEARRSYIHHIESQIRKINYLLEAKDDE